VVPSEDDYTLEGEHYATDDAPPTPGVPQEIPDVYAYPTPTQVPPYGAA
jgi:hypothetical protein